MRDITLRCVACGAEGLTGLRCAACGTTFLRHPDGDLPIYIGKRSRLDATAIAARRAQQPDLERGQRHWEHGKLAEWIASAPRGKLLSYGCGDGGDRASLEALGYDVTAFDIYAAPTTDLIADGHDLPFADRSFDVVTFISVLQDLPDPFQATAEIGRVLRPGGELIGSVAFLEPFTGANHFNMSHLGLAELLRRAGLGDVEIEPGWSSLEALSRNFWVWSHVAATRKLSLAWNRLKYRAGLGMLQGLYRLRGKQAPAALPLHFAASLLFRARRR